MKPQLQEFYAIYAEWSTLRQELKPAEKRNFAKWILRVHPDIAQPFKSNPAQFLLMCREIQNGGKLPLVKGIGDALLRRYMPELAKRYLALPKQSRDTFQDFVNTILEQHPNERALKRFLG